MNATAWRAGLRSMLCVAAVALAACSSSPELPPLAPGSTILAFGDSLTAGVGAARGESYPSVLAELTGFEVINAGISGETAEQGRQRLAAELDRHAPDLLILMEGGNDILRNRAPAAIKQDLAAMLDAAAARDIPVVLLGIPEKKLFSDVAPLYRELAEENGVVFVDDLISNLLRDSDYKSDPIHLNAAGYRRLAEELRALLRDSGAL